MRTLFVSALAALLFSTFSPSGARAEGFFGGSVDSAPSVFTYGYRGFWVGTLTGLSTGYLVARHDGWEGDDWRPLVLGGGIGAVSGAVFGLGCGFIDLADDRPGLGAFVLRDTLYGALFGMTVGAVVGGLYIIKTHDAENLLFGASIGTLVGTGLGVGVGFIEGARMRDSPAHRYGRAPRVSLSLAATEDAGERLVWLPGLRTRF